MIQKISLRWEYMCYWWTANELTSVKIIEPNSSENLLALDLRNEIALLKFQAIRSYMTQKIILKLFQRIEFESLFLI